MQKSTQNPLLLKLFNWYTTKGAYYLKYFILLPNTGCRFHPTCSHYTKLSIEKHGLLKGSLKSVWRILRCNPYSKGGVDYP